MYHPRSGWFVFLLAITSARKRRKEVKRLGRTCIECNSGTIGKIEERELRQFRFEKIEFACGAILESFHTANGNVARAIHSGCPVAE